MMKWRGVWVGAIALLLAGAGGIRAADIRLQGAGATFPAPLYNKWVEEYQKVHPDVKVDYQAVGSGAGIKAITDRTVGFGATDAPLTAEQQKAAPGKLLHVPTVAGACVMIYNLEGVKDLTLDGAVVADIYLKKIEKWNDPRLAALNPDIKLPDQPIVVVHRSDGSGTTYMFTDYLGKASQEWSDKVGKGTTVEWPTGVASKGEGPAGPVKAISGSIGYVEYAYAKKNNMTWATVLNKAGKPADPSVEAIEAAASASLPLPEDSKLSITDAPGDTSYPMCAYSYLLIYEDLSYMADEGQARATAEFMLWCETDGIKFAHELGYACLPEKAREQVVARLKAVTFNGKALLP